MEPRITRVMPLPLLIRSRANLTTGGRIRLRRGTNTAMAVRRTTAPTSILCH